MNNIKFIGMLVLFFWISFLAPLVSEQYRFIFIGILGVLLLLFIFLEKSSYKLIFSRKEALFWLFLLTMMGGLVNIKDVEIGYRYFWNFIFPIPFLYFFAKISFREQFSILMLRAICFMCLLICLFGIIEFITKRNFLYADQLIGNFCYVSFRGRRMMSAQIHPAPLGTYLAAIFPLSIVLILKEKKMFFKSSAIIYAIIILVSIFLTFSRGAFIGVIVSMSIMLFFLFKRKMLFFISLSILLLAVITIIGISSLLLYYCDCNMFYRFSLSGLSETRIYLGKTGRLISICKILSDYPFFGLGFGQYRILFDHYLPHLASITSQLSKVQDCMYIAILTETGLVGFTGFMLFICSLFKKIWHRLKLASGYRNGLLILGFLSGTIGILGAFLTYDVLYWVSPCYLFWSYAGILSSLSE